MSNALQRLTKWRTVFAGWQLGSRPKGDPEGDAVRDHRELTILLRAECNAMVRLMVEKNIITLDEWSTTLDEEAEHLSKSYERKFPGAKATDYGMDLNIALWRDTTQGWRP